MKTKGWMNWKRCYEDAMEAHKNPDLSWDMTQKSHDAAVMNVIGALAWCNLTWDDAELIARILVSARRGHGFCDYRKDQNPDLREKLEKAGFLIDPHGCEMNGFMIVWGFSLPKLKE